MEPLANPGAGAQFVYTVPAGEFWRPVLLRAFFIITTGGAVRSITLRPQRAGELLAWFTLAATVTLAGTYGFTWGRSIGVGYTVSGTPLFQMAPLGDLTLSPGDELRSGVGNMAGDDQWQTVRLSVEKIPA